MPVLRGGFRAACTMECVTGEHTECRNGAGNQDPCRCGCHDAEFWGDRLLREMREQRAQSYRNILTSGTRALMELREDQMRSAGVMDGEGRIRLDG